MQASLFETKLYQPKRLDSSVNRPRLVSKLDEGAKRKLTLVSAPPGFGKTTLVSDWARECDRPVSWLSLDDTDNDPAVFLGYIVAAMQQIDGRIGTTIPAIIKSSQNLPTITILAKLAGDIATVAENIILTLDDYHTINNPSIHEGIAWLIDHQPENLHIIITGRADPPLPLARLRVREELIEIRADDLRFTKDEAVTFLNDVMHLGLSTDNIAALDARTEGWIASLQLAALSLKERSDKEGFIASFSGSHRHIFDYLVDEALAGLPEDMQIFLLETSVLARFSAALCDTVLETGDSQERLEELEKANLFIVPLDDERRWWRYHHLFADFLNQRLKQKRSERLPDLHKRAAMWLAKNRFVGDAVKHSLAAGDFELTADIIEPVAMEMVSASQVIPLLNWSANLPDEAIAKRPTLAIGQAWASVLTGRIARVEDYLKMAESSLTGNDSAQAEELLSHAMTIRAYIARAVGDLNQAIDLSLEALKLMPEQALAARAAVTINLATAYARISQFDQAIIRLHEALKAAEGSANYYVSLAAYGGLTEMLTAQGRYSEATSLAQEAISKSLKWGGGQQLPAAGYIYVGLAHILNEYNDLESAQIHALQSIDLCEQIGQIGVAPGAYLCLAKVNQASGNLKAADDAIAKAKTADAAMPETPNDAVERLATAQRISSFEARIRMARGDEARVRQWLSNIETMPEDVSPYYYHFDELTAIQALVFIGQSEVALEKIDALIGPAKAEGRLGHVAELLATKVTALEAVGERDQALYVLIEALKMGKEQGRIRLFIDLGSPVLELLRQLPPEKEPSEYIKQLIQAFRAPTRSHAGTPGDQALVDPLSERELEVLRLIADGLKYREIADKLVVSLNTVRAHTKNIYNKLGVNSGSQAAKKAAELELL